MRGRIMSLGRYTFINKAGNEVFEVDFDGLQSGTVTRIFGNSSYRIGHYYNSWIPYTKPCWKKSLPNICLDDSLFEFEE
jgi:hypothetical protein